MTTTLTLTPGDKVRIIEFEKGQYIVFKGETGARWNYNGIYIYLGNGVITDKNGDIKKPTWPNFIEDNFTAYRGKRYCDDVLKNI